jgi:superfamily II DNA or RNA helicase
MNYEEFLKQKIKTKELEIIFTDELSSNLFDFQKDIVRWALNRKKAAIFAGTGMGKTLMQLEWSQQIYNKIGGKILIIAPLAVSCQTVSEGQKFGYIVKRVDDQSQIANGINIINYEKISHIDFSQITAIVLDESSILKSKTGKYKSELINNCKEIEYKLCCTATPSPNDHIELGNHSEFLDELRESEMLSTYFVHDSGSTKDWRIKGHAIDSFWEWVASWAAIITKPSDFDYPDDDFNLPQLNIKTIFVESAKIIPGYLFAIPATTLSERRDARKCSTDEKYLELLKIINDEIWLIWCDLNKESEYLYAQLADSIEITGSDSDEKKEKSMIEFSRGEIKKLVTKPQIAGFGMNWQVCHNVVFFGLSDSFERYYQAIRRCWRFGQKSPVNVYVILSELEKNTHENIKEKEKKANEMMDRMSVFSKKFVKKNMSFKKHESKYQAEKEIILPKFMEVNYGSN